MKNFVFSDSEVAESAVGSGSRSVLIQPLIRNERCPGSRNGVHHFVLKDGSYVCRDCGCGEGWLKPPVEVGTVFYARETWTQGGGEYLYRADMSPGEASGYRWISPVQMPRNAARIFGRVKNVEIVREPYMSAAARQRKRSSPRMRYLWKYSYDCISQDEAVKESRKSACA